MATRRQFVQGVSLGASGFLLNPILGKVQAEAAGVARRPTRFVFLVEGNGLNPKQIHPEGIPFVGREKRKELADTPLVDLKLPPALDPLNEYKDKLTIVQGLSGRIAGGGHSNNFGALGAFNAQGGVGRTGKPAAETIDAALGKANPAIFPLVTLGITDRPEHTVVYNCSAWRAGQKLPTQCRPDLAHNMLFGAVAKGEGKKDFAARTNLLDYIVDDIKRVQTRFGTEDRQKLDQYLQSYESLRDRRSRLVEVSDALRKVAPVPDDKYQSAVETDRLDAHFDMAAAALIGGLTNVVTIASGVGDPYFSVKFTGLGIDFGKHGIGHGGSYNGMTWDQMAVKIRRFHFELVARLMKKLEAIREGDGTMLDNTVIVYLSDAAEGHHSRCWEWPFVVIGDLGGRLKRPGRYLSYPNYGLDGHRTTNCLYNTFLHAAGAPRDDFGQSDPKLAEQHQKGPLSELLS